MIGQGMAILFGFVGLQGNPMLIFIALFVWIGAGQEASMAQMKSSLAGIPVRRAMLTHFRTLTPDEYTRRCRGSAPDGFAAGFSGRQRRAGRGHVDAERPDRGADASRQKCTCRRPYATRTCATAEASEMLETVLARLQRPRLPHGADHGTRQR